MHREDIKAAIRKRWGTLTAFERANALPPKSVNDVLRGRKSARVQKAIDSLVNNKGVDNYTTERHAGNAA